jgi:glyoxylase-like metal-dependent hydrolase (beta-lactamase superfamily II)
MIPRPSAIAAVLAVATSLAAAAAVRPAARLRLTTLSQGVHLVSPVDVADRDRTNALVVEQASGLLVVNAQPSPEAAREMLGLLASALPNQKVRHLALLHPHADAAGGASAFPEGTLVIASEGTALDLADSAYDFGAEARERSGGTFREPPRPKVGLRLQGNAVLDDSQRPVTFFPLAPGHSRGDLLVEIPSADLMAAGSLLFKDRNPWAGTASIGGWIGHLSNLVSSGRGTFLPLQGPPVDAQEVRSQRDTFAWARGEIDAAFVDRTPATEIPARILASSRAATYFDLAASPSFARGVLEQAVREAQAQRRKFGLEK